MLIDDIFQREVVEWLRAGGIEEGKSAKSRLIASMTAALSRSGAPQERLELKNEYFDALDRAVFSNSILAAWRHQLSLDFLREQVAFLRQMAEEAAGIYSKEKRQAALDHYCDQALSAWDIIDLSNLPEGDIHIATQKLLLRQLYMPLRVTVEVTREHGADDAAFALIEQRRAAIRLREAGRDTRHEPKRPDGKQRSSVGERLGVARRLVVLGDPGGGKTTMMRWMATTYLLRYRGDTAWKQIPDAGTLPNQHWIPVLIRCRDLGEADLCRSFADFLTQHLRKSELRPEHADVMRAVILESIARGGALILVDGLDEITNPQIRMMFCQELERTAARYPDAPIAVTSRIVGYRDMPYRMGSGFEHSVITELTRPEKDLFAKRWIDVTEQHQPVAEKARRVQDLVDALHSSDRIERLTGNAMLLTTLALVKRKVGKLPSRRTKLYAEAVAVLLNWNPRYYETIDEDEATPQLEFLAYDMCRRGVQSLTQDEILDLLDRARREYPNIRAMRRREPDVFLGLLEARSSLLIKSGGQWMKVHGGEKPVWEFRHLTFQEYLAARALLDGRYPDRDRMKTLAEQVTPLAGSVTEVRHRSHPEPEFEVAESWQEALRLLVADCKDDDVDDVLRAIANPAQGEDAAKTARPRAILAARCLVDEPNTGEETAGNILSALANQVGQYDGNGTVNTSLDTTAVELGKGHWAPLLKACLIREYLRLPPDVRWRLGGLWGTANRYSAPRDQEEFNAWFSSLAKQLSLGDETEACGAALTIMDCAFAGVAIEVPGLIDGLLSLLQSTRPIRFAAAWALGWLSKGSPMGTDRAPVWQPKSGEVPSLIKAFESVDEMETDILRWLAVSLGVSKDSRAVKPLVKRLGNPDPALQAVVIEALSGFGGQDITDRLITELGNTNAGVRLALVEALGKLGGREVAGALVSRLDDPDTGVRRAVVEALGKLGGEGVVGPLIRKLDDHPVVREAVVRALSNLGGQEVVSGLYGSLEDPHVGIRVLAAGTLAGSEMREARPRSSSSSMMPIPKSVGEQSVRGLMRANISRRCHCYSSSGDHRFGLTLKSQLRKTEWPRLLGISVSIRRMFARCTKLWRMPST